MLNPIKNTTRNQNDGGYDADSGLDILCKRGTPVYAAKSGTIIYSEHGHTPWGTVNDIGIDTPNSILIKLDEPIVGQNKTVYPYNWYTHLSELYYKVPDPGGSEPAAGAKHVNAGDLLGYSGIGNKVAHLHFGVVHDREQSVTMPQREIAAILWPKPHTNTIQGVKA